MTKTTAAAAMFRSRRPALPPMHTPTTLVGCLALILISLLGEQSSGETISPIATFAGGNGEEPFGDWCLSGRLSLASRQKVGQATMERCSAFRLPAVRRQPSPRPGANG